MLDMRFLRNPYWQPELRSQTGQDAQVAAYVAGDPLYDQAMARIEALLKTVLPRYSAEGEPMSPFAPAGAIVPFM